MELYLRWLDKYERRPGEEPPLGLILCAGKKKERIELLISWTCENGIQFNQNTKAEVVSKANFAY